MMKVLYGALLLSSWFFTSSLASTATGDAECDSIVNDVGMGICEDYFSIDCQYIFVDDCAAMKFLYYQETGEEPTWTEGVDTTEKSEATELEEVLIDGSDEDDDLEDDDYFEDLEDYDDVDDYLEEGIRHLRTSAADRRAARIAAREKRQAERAARIAARNAAIEKRKAERAKRLAARKKRIAERLKRRAEAEKRRKQREAQRAAARRARSYCNGVRGSRRGMCIGYHSIGAGAGQATCVEDPTQVPCMKISTKYEAKFGVAIPTPTTDESGNPTTSRPSPSPTPNPTPLPSPSPTPLPTPLSSPGPTPNPTPLPSPSPTPLPTPNPTPSPTRNPTPNPTASPTPMPTPHPTPFPTDANDCLGDPCLNGGICSDEIGGFTCACPDGFEGPTCDTNIDDCSPNPCMNGGVCTDGVGDYTCTCSAGFSGPTCATDDDDCASNPCLNGGTCIDGVNSYTCDCGPDFGGPNCGIDLVPSAVPSSAPTTGAPTLEPQATPAPTPAPTTPSPVASVSLVPKLAEEILQDMLPASSSQCTPEPTLASYTFESSQAESSWYCPFSDYEDGLFLAKMEHFDNNANRSWTIRMGQAGNIYSMVGPMGETVPPQAHDEAPFVDEVWQQVQPYGPNGDQDNNPASNPYFIHEAGTYARDLQRCNSGLAPYPLPSDCNGSVDLTTTGGCRSGAYNGVTRFNCPLVNQQGVNLGGSPSKGCGNNGGSCGLHVVVEGAVSGTRLQVGVNHWSFNGGRFYFFAVNTDGTWDSTKTLTDINNAFSNQKLNVYYANDPSSSEECFDYTATPFFSPTLGSFCKGTDGECGFMSWGQQAHLPTPWKSPLLYMNRYVNCGNGVIEYTQLRHHNGVSESFNYANAPWGGTRNSVLKDVVFTSASGGDANGHDKIYNPGTWGGDTRRRLEDTLGYTMFVQELERSPASDPNAGQPYSFPSGWVGTTTGQCTQNGSCGDLPRYRCPIQGQTVISAGSNGIALTFTVNTPSGTTTTLDVGNVVHWAWNGNGLFICPVASAPVTLAEVNAAVPAGSTIASAVYYSPPVEPTGIRDDDNLALAHVFGVPSQPQTNDYPRVRFGRSQRDYNVYTINPKMRLNPGDTYYYRQYFIMDSYKEMKTNGPIWATEAGDGKYAAGGKAGRDVKLYADSTTSTFGFSVSGNANGGTCPLKQSSINVCTGSTVPSAGLKALFYIECGSTRAVTSDPYIFAPIGPEIPGGTKQRPYQCADEALGTRPTWTMLGFFNEADCSGIASGYEFQEEKCAPLQ